MPKIVLAAALAGLLGGCVSTQIQAPQPSTASGYADEALPASDILIEDAVRTELTLARHVPAGHIDVEADDGIVALSGAVPTLLGKERALRVVKHLRGVRGVVDQLTVARSAVPDAHVLTAVDAALAVDPATEPLEIEASIDDGTVTLSGTVDSFAEKAIAADVTRSIVGVRELHNRLAVKTPAYRSDAEIEADVVQRLYWDVRIAHEYIDVDVRDGVVYFDGVVGSLFDRDMVMMRGYVAGARDVNIEQLEVDRLARTLRRTTAAVPADSAIELAVIDVLEADPRVAAFDPQIDVDEGIVTLSGIVDNVKARNAAAEAARNTYGVVAVRNQLEVQPRSPLSDADLDRYVSIALSRDVFVTDQPIEVDVEDSVVTLNGTVDSYFERSHAEDVAARMVSVRDVINELRVTYPVPVVSYEFFDWNPLLDHYAYDRTLVGQLPDEQIRRNVLRELFWSPYVDSGEVMVFVEDGVVTLKGFVPGVFAVRDAVQSAYAGGAIDVKAQLRVEDRIDRSASILP